MSDSTSTTEIRQIGGEAVLFDTALGGAVLAPVEPVATVSAPHSQPSASPLAVAPQVLAPVDSSKI